MKAIVAWDNLAAPDPNQTTGASGGGPQEQPCPANPAARSVPPITKPALGMSADYFIPPEPNTSEPEPLAKSQESFAYTAAGVDTGEIIIRAGPTTTSTGFQMTASRRRCAEPTRSPGTRPPGSTST